MKKGWWLVGLWLCGLAFSVQAATERLVTLGGNVTEIVFALGQGSKLVATDASSLYPEAARDLPSVGYYRTVPVEGVIAQAPDLVLASENAGPPKALKRLKDLGVTVHVLPDKPTLNSLYQRIQSAADELGVTHAGRQLVDQIQLEVDEVQQMPAESLRTLVLVNRSGPLLAAGSQTTAAAILELSGLQNALPDQQGYKPVSPEGLAKIAPELIVITKASLQSSGGMEEFRASPGISATPAAQHNRIIVMDDLLIQAIGPRIATAIRELKVAAQ